MKRLFSLVVLLASILSANLAQAGNKPWAYIQDATKRFVVLPEFYDQAVLDRATGLIWTKAPRGGSFEWTQAVEGCLSSSVGAITNGRLGIGGWRLPEAHELLSLTEFRISCGNGNCGANFQLPQGHPFEFETNETTFWSATPALELTASNEEGAFIVDVGFGAVNAPRTEEFPVWCVRG